MSDTERKGIEMSENAKWLREIANGTLVQAYDQADYLAASAMNDVLRGKFVSAADEIESLRARIAELEAKLSAAESNRAACAETLLKREAEIEELSSELAALERAARAVPG